MSNFDLDSYLFGEITDKKLEEKTKEEPRERITEQEGHIQKNEEFVKIHPRDLSMAEQKNRSTFFISEKEEKEQEAEEIEMGQGYEDDLPEWKDKQSIELSREDIIKGINFSSKDVKETLRPYDYSQQDKNEYTNGQNNETVVKAKEIEGVKDEKEKAKKDIQIKDESFSTPQVRPEGENFNPNPENNHNITPPPPPPPEKPKLQESKPEEPPKQKNEKKNIGFFLKIFIYFLLFIILCLLLVFAYLNRDAISQFGKSLESSDNEINIEQEMPVVISKRQFIEENRDNVSLRNELDIAVNNLLSGNYKILTDGGFVLIYTEFENGVELEHEIEMTFGNGESYAYFQKGLLSYIYIDEDNIKIVWDEDNNKYIVSEEREEYILVAENSNEKYRDFLGQHILQNLTYEYLKDKSSMKELGPQAWIWDWSFHTPINNYKTRNLLNTVIIVNEETNLIDEIKLYDSDKKIGEYFFEYEVLKEKDSFDFNILEKYTLVEELHPN
jgi:hypothetical protein